MLLFLREGRRGVAAPRRLDAAAAWMRDPVDIERYVADLGRPGALTAALNYYRANIPAQSLTGRPAPDAAGGGCPVLASGPTVTSAVARPRCSPRSGRDGAVAVPPDHGRRALDPAGRPGRARDVARRVPALIQRVVGTARGHRRRRGGGEGGEIDTVVFTDRDDAAAGPVPVAVSVTLSSLPSQGTAMLPVPVIGKPAAARSGSPSTEKLPRRTRFCVTHAGDLGGAAGARHRLRACGTG